MNGVKLLTPVAVTVLMIVFVGYSIIKSGFGCSG